jgi:hypothetical protein
MLCYSMLCSVIKNRGPPAPCKQEDVWAPNRSSVVENRTILWLFLESKRGPSVIVQFIHSLRYILILLNNVNSYCESPEFWHQSFGGIYCLYLHVMMIDVTLSQAKHRNRNLAYLLDLWLLRGGVRTHTHTHKIRNGEPVKRMLHANHPWLRRHKISFW